MDQIIGSYKEFIVVERELLLKMESDSFAKLETNKERPLSEASIEARSVINVVNYLKDNNIYNKDFKIKG